MLQGSASVVASGPSVAFLIGMWNGEMCWKCYSRSDLSGIQASNSYLRVTFRQRLLGEPSLLEKYSPMSTLPISTKSRSTTEPSKYPKAGPNTAMAKRMAEKEAAERACVSRERERRFSAAMAFVFCCETGTGLQQAEERNHLLSSGRQREEPHCSDTECGIYLKGLGGQAAGKVPLLCCSRGFADVLEVVSYTMNICDSL